jgi:hypothetical protein
MYVALNDFRWKLSVILDGCPREYIEALEKVFITGDVTFIETDSIGNNLTYDRQVDLLVSEREAEYVYFAEDDYIYEPEAFKAMLDWMARPNVDFVTPLDHPGYYLPDSIAARVHIRVSPFRHWREIGSTCLTFMTKVETLRKHEETFRHFSRCGEEGTQWLAFTHENTHNVFVLLRALLKWITRSPCSFGLLMPLCAWRWHWRMLLFKRRYHLWAPIPSLAIHCSKVSLPPFSGQQIACELGERLDWKSYLGLGDSRDEN